MREFFKPWRRKLGVVTLVMACVLMGVWIRSRAVCDVLYLNFWDEDVTVNLINSQLVLSHNWLAEYQPARIIWKRYQPIDSPKALYGSDFELTHQFAGFGFFNGGNLTILAAPYWLIVTPLTLLSACLLLGKPQPAKPIVPADSDHA